MEAESLESLIAEAGRGPAGGPGLPGREALLDLVGRRSFLKTALGGTLGLAASLSWPGRLAAQNTDGAPKIVLPSLGPKVKPQPESNRKMAALLEKITRS